MRIPFLSALADKFEARCTSLETSVRDEAKTLIGGLRADIEKALQERDRAILMLQTERQQFADAINGLGDAFQDVFARLKYYEENVTFLKLANKSYNEKIRADAERDRVARIAADRRRAEADVAAQAAAAQATPQPKPSAPPLALMADAPALEDEPQLGEAHD